MSIYEILPAIDLTQSTHAKISIGMHRGVKFKISRIPLIGLETRLGWRTDRKFLWNSNLVLSRVARFYATTEQKLIHSFWIALRIRRKINQLHQSSCYASSIYYTTQNNPWICRYRFNRKVFFIFSVSPLIHVK